MRRYPLPPARLVTPDVATLTPTVWPRAEAPRTEPPAGVSALPRRDRLDDPVPARMRRRPWFHPKTGWFRNLERQASHWLSREIYHRIPGLSLVYDRQLDRTLTLSEAVVELPGLPPAFDGVRLLLITDPHAGPFVSPSVLARALARLQALQPDLILLGGDLTTSRVEEIDSHLDAFRQLHAPLGVFAVLGNHDHYTGESKLLRRRIEGLGIPVLHNRAEALRRRAATLHLAGVDDMLMGRPDLDRALADTAGPVVLLSHHPDLFFDAARRGVALMLSGHTHGGQVRLPGLPVLVRQSRYRLDEGRYRTGQTELIVSRGLGAVGVPWRFACPPEAVAIELRRPVATPEVSDPGE